LLMPSFPLIPVPIAIGTGMRGKDGISNPKPAILKINKNRNPQNGTAWFHNAGSEWYKIGFMKSC